MKGWKTKLGLTLLAVGKILSSTPIFGDDVTQGVVLPLSQILSWTGGLLATYGIAHKVEKAGIGGG